MPVIFFFDVRVTAARESGQSGDFQLTRKEKRIMNAVFLPMVVINKGEMTKGGGWRCRRLVTADRHGLRPRNDDGG
jgi:hypothetical protein